MVRPTQNQELRLRADWPYPTVLPYSIKVYPVVQTLPEIEAPAVSQWPWPMQPSLAAEHKRQKEEQACNQIYLHVPFCPFLCSFCPLYKVDTPSSHNGALKERFLKAVLQEIRHYGETAAANRTYHSIYLGGGTPTELSPSQLAELLKALRENFRIADDAEITLEGVAQQMLRPGYLKQCIDNGFNRISFGAQSLDPQVRRMIGRGDDVADYPAVIELARSLDEAIPVNLEIMAGQPGQSLASLESDVQKLISWGPDSIDILYYVMMHGSKLVDLIRDGSRPSPAFGADLLEMRRYVNATLPENGYHQFTAEAFARRSDRDLFAAASFGGGGSLNTILALGPSAFGQLEGNSYHNICNLKRYVDLLDNGRFPVQRATRLTPNVARMRQLLLSLVRLQISDELLATSSATRRAVRRWTRAGLVRQVAGGYEFTANGKLWYNHMQMEVLPAFDRVKSLRIFGSIDEQRALLSPNPATLRAHEREMWLQLRSEGRLKFWSYNLVHLLYESLPFLDRRAIGFTGPTESRKRKISRASHGHAIKSPRGGAVK